MPIDIVETAANFKSSKLNTLIQTIFAAGEGPGKAPYIDARELAGLLGASLTVPTYAFGEFTVADGANEQVVKLDFEPKLVLLFIDSATDAFLVKMAQMGAGTPDIKTALRFLVGGASAMGDFVSLRDETVPVAPATYDLNAFTVWNAAVATNDVVSWMALG